MSPIQRLGEGTVERDARVLRTLLAQADTEVGGGAGDHGALTGLDDDDHNQYVHRTLDRIIYAQHSFEPVGAQAPFTLGTNAQGQLVTGFNADLLDGLNTSSDPAATAAVCVTDANGYLRLARLLLGASGSDPSYPLHVVGTAGIDGDLTFVGAQQITTTTGALSIVPAAGYGLLVTLSGAGDFVVNTNQLYVDTSTGYVGIGTATPGVIFHVYRSSGNVLPKFESGNASTVGIDLINSLRTWRLRNDSSGNFIFVDLTGSVYPFRIEAGSYSDQVHLTSSETVINDTSAAINFRVESDTSANALFLEGATGNICLGANSPSARLDIRSSAAATTGLVVRAAAAQTANIQEWQSSAAAVLAYIDASGDLWLATPQRLYLRDSALYIYSSADGQLDIDADTEVEITAPTIQLVAATKVRIDGTTEVDGDLTFIGAQSILTDGAGDLTIAPAGDLLLNPTGAQVRMMGGTLQSDNYASQTTGWGVSYIGGGDFRYLFADEMHVKSFIADMEQALAGGQIITKSVAVVATDFTVPAASGAGTLVVEDLAAASGLAVFQTGDIVRLRQFTRPAGGSLVVADCWGVVTGYSDNGDGTQDWTFTRSAGADAGAAVATTIIEKGTLALDYGVSGNGFYEVNAIDGAWGANSPYAQIVTWTTHPHSGQSVKTRLGQLTGITAQDEYGLLAGSGVAVTDQYIRASSFAFEIHNIDFTVHDGANTVIRLDRSAPYISIGATAPTGYLSHDGFWVGNDSGTYKMHLGDVDGERLVWDGTLLWIYAGAGTYMYASGTGLTFYCNSLRAIKLDASTGTITVGNDAAADGYFTETTAAGFKIYERDTSASVLRANFNDTSLDFYHTDGATVLASIGATITLCDTGGVGRLSVATTGITVGNVAGGEYVSVTSTGVDLYQDAHKMLGLASGSVTIYDATGASQAALAASGVRVGLAASDHVTISASGIQLVYHTTVRGEWQTDGDIFIGSNTAAPATTHFAVFTNAQNYGVAGSVEAMGAGDILVGDNTAGQASILWDKSEARLYFRAESRQMRMAAYGIDFEVAADIGLVWKDDFDGNNYNVGFLRVGSATYDMEISTGGDDIANWQDFTLQTRSSSGTTRTPLYIDATNKEIGIYQTSPAGTFHIKQGDSAGAKPALVIEQDDIDQPFVFFKDGTVYTGLSGLDEFIRIQTSAGVRHLRCFN